MKANNSKIIYTLTDEAPMLATHSLFPIISSYVGKAGVKLEIKDISLAARVLASFPDWVLTKHDAVDELVAGENSAVFKVVARWLTQDEKPHKPITAVWITVRKEGKWGLQFRYNMGSI